MARVLGNPFGELRGKVGGIVFSRNRAGQFTRGYVKPAQANSVAQANARLNFGDASQQYSALTSFNKIQWQTFANAVYNPLRKTNIGQYNSQQAYIGIKQSAKMSQEKIITTVFEPLGGGAAHVYTGIDFTTSQNAPAFTVVGTVTGTGTAGPIPMFTSNIVLPATGNMSFDLNFGTTGVGKLAGDFVDSNGKAFAVGFYLSEPLKFNGQSAKNKYFMFIGNTPIPNFTTNLPDGTLGVEVSNMQIAYQDFKQWVVPTQWVLVTSLAIGQDGTQVKISEEYIEVS